MIRQLKNLNRWNITLLLIVMSLFSFGLSVARIMITGIHTFLFLNWNLFLAFIPWCISTVILVRGLNKSYILALLVVAWLLFFPNSPYILTDLFHLRVIDSAPIWFDLILILSFAWTGLLYGFISLMDIEQLLSKHFPKRAIAMLSVFFLFLSGFGIYLGRFLRWNSWDIISNPLGLLADIAERFINPFAHGRTWGLTILIGILLNMMYFSLKLLHQKKATISI
jgi:uncharacterized membrane protein